MNKQTLMPFFDYASFPEKLTELRKGFYDLAHLINNCTVDNIEKSAALRKLLKARDCAKRAVSINESIDAGQRKFLEELRGL